ncbi:MAG: hypothetical protein IJA58_07815, partial [Lachnospiraceae bacterium]|nr:hypothetical protein [Lachnospiraceae bacterium]
DEVFIGRDLAHTRSYSESMATVIDNEVKAIIDDCYAKAYEIIKKHEQVLYRATDLLMEKEKISGEEFAALFDGPETEKALEEQPVVTTEEATE